MGYKRALASALLCFGDIHAARRETAEAKASYEEARMLAAELQLPFSIAKAEERLERLV